MKTIEKSSHFMLNLVNDLLDLSLIESGGVNLVKHDLDLVQLIEEIVSQNRMFAAKKGIQIILESCDSTELEFDPNKFEQVLMNLITNAVKFSHKGYNN